jgi:hypothetical protein
VAGGQRQGQLAYPNFTEIVNQLMPFYWLRVIGGSMYLTGAVMMAGTSADGPRRAARGAGRPRAGRVLREEPIMTDTTHEGTEHWHRVL